MTVKLRFFAKFREHLGTDLLVPVNEGSTVLSLVRETASRNREGYDAIFDDKGSFHEFVIVMRNGKRIEHGDAATTRVADGDELAVFPPVAGG
jgi:molybdopterin synthase sulfur carrier subunit